jgi:hypothetical protein
MEPKPEASPSLTLHQRIQRALVDVVYTERDGIISYTEALLMRSVLVMARRRLLKLKSPQGDPNAPR